MLNDEAIKIMADTYRAALAFERMAKRHEHNAEVYKSIYRTEMDHFIAMTQMAAILTDMTAAEVTSKVLDAVYGFES